MIKLVHLYNDTKFIFIHITIPIVYSPRHNKGRNVTHDFLPLSQMHIIFLPYHRHAMKRVLHVFDHSRDFTFDLTLALCKIPFLSELLMILPR